MKKSAVTNQLKRIKVLRTSVQKAQNDLRKLRDFTAGVVFRDAVNGQHDFFRPSIDRKEYMRRWEHYRPDTEERVQDLLESASKLPKFSGQRWDNRRQVRIGIIADSFLYESIEPAAVFIPLTPSNYDEELERIDLLLVVSTWRGLDGEWHGAAMKSSPKRKLIESKLIPLARDKGIPVAFYSKEDPPNYDRFISLAKKADVVFTSAIEKIDDYRDDLDRDIPVYPLRFGVNYEKHNPLGCMRHQGRELIFAGSWMGHKYEERTKAALDIFQGVNDSESSLTIVDRNLNLDPKKFSDPDRYLYPENFLPNLHGPLEHDEVLSLQKLLPLALNLNSVIGSQTMFANRVVELLAMGTLVLSNYSVGVNSLYPYVTQLHSSDDTTRFIDMLTPEYIRYCQVEGIRGVFTKDTAFDRVDEILAAVGLTSERATHRILVVADSEEAFEKFSESQATERVLSYVPANEAEATTGSVDGDLVINLAKLSVSSPDIVDDAVAAYRYSDVDSLRLISFDSAEEAYEPRVVDEQASDCEVFWLPAGQAIGETVSKSVMTIMTSAPTKRRSGGVAERELSVIVPTYNNGPHLIHKCFNSLYRGSAFERSQIIIVDDGSTDVKTKACVDLLETRFPNVQVYRFPEGGSGSASRPRNKGLDLVETPYVTYLDPDNEEVRDSYAFLLNTCKEQEVDFAIGNMLRMKSKIATVNNARHLRNALAKAPMTNGHNLDLLEQLKFQPMSIQALVARSDWLKSLKLEQPVGAVGQDSYFFQQMIFYARNIFITTRPVHVYYGAVTNSTVNSISPKFYRKYLILEAARTEWLREVGLFDAYVRTRFKTFFKGWYLDKLSFVAPEDRRECVLILKEINEMYGAEAAEDPEIVELLDRALDE